MSRFRQEMRSQATVENIHDAKLLHWISFLFPYHAFDVGKDEKVVLRKIIAIKK